MASRARTRGRRIGTADLLPILVAVLLVLGLAQAAGLLQRTGLSDWLTEANVAEVKVAQQHFGICGAGLRVTCVVDGDTFWLGAEKIRIADINTPEVSSPECAAEAALGRQATAKLAELLSAGPFSLRPIERDEDRYGRKLRVIVREGQSLGMTLVTEGLAEEWGGVRRAWC